MKVLGLSLIVLCTLSYTNVSAENYVCGTDLDGDGYSDGENETTACIKTSTQNYFCPIQAVDCESTRVEDINESACLSYLGNWNSGDTRKIEKTYYFQWGGNEDIVGAIISEEYTYTLWRGEYVFTRNGSNTKSSPDLITGNNANKSAPWGNSPTYTTSLTRGTGEDRESYNGFVYFPSEWASWQPLKNGRFALYSIDEDWVRTRSKVSDMQFNGTGWKDASSYFDSNIGISQFEELLSVNYYIKAKERGDRNDGVYLKAEYIVSVQPHCSFDDGRTSVYVSPIDGGACTNVNGNYMDDVNACIDLDTAEPEEEYDISGEMLTDDGQRDGEGNCVDELLLFTGRGQSCKTKGLQSAYQNCCKFDGELSNQDIGSYQQTKLKLDAIHGLYTVSKAAYTAYSTAVAAGASQAAAASAAGSAAGTQMAVAFDPTTLAIAAGVYLVTEWIANACSETDLDTAAAKATGNCVEVGSFCSKKYKFIGCVQRKRSFCCFNGKMQRIFHEQGRPQLSTFGGFGSAKNPDCRGFTPEEFQSIDFSKIDLSDYYSELNHNTSVEVNSVMTSKTQEFYESVQ